MKLRYVFVILALAVSVTYAISQIVFKDSTEDYIEGVGHQKYVEQIEADRYGNIFYKQYMSYATPDEVTYYKCIYDYLLDNYGAKRLVEIDAEMLNESEQGIPAEATQAVTYCSGV